MAWNELFSELLEFKQEWGHCDVLLKYAKNPELVLWVSTHICQYILLKSGKKYLISDEKIAQLEKLDSDGFLIVGSYIARPGMSDL